MWRSVFCLALFLVTGCGRQGQAAPAVAGHLYTTWTTLELDKCASAWLLKRFVDPAAEFRFVPEGELIAVGTPFDTPDAALTRTHDHTTYESIVLAYSIDDPAVAAIGRWVRAIEIDYWGSVDDPNAIAVDADIQRIIDNAPNEHQALELSFAHFDRLYEHLTDSLSTAKEKGGGLP
jgi:hypothetical protein